METDEIWDRIVEAADVDRRLVVAIGPAGVRSSWPDVVQSAANAYGYGEAEVKPAPPSGAEIDRTDEVMGWLQALGRRDQRILWSRANRVPWWAVQQRLGCSQATALRWQRAALDTLAQHVKQLTAQKTKKL